MLAALTPGGKMRPRSTGDLFCRPSQRRNSNTVKKLWDDLGSDYSQN